MGQVTGTAAETPAPPRAQKKPMRPVGRVTGRERHLLPGWYEWTLRELLRYFYALGILSLLAFVPLQMSDSWLPENGTAVMSAGAVGGIALAFIVGLCVLAGFAYRYLWGEDGLIDRVVERHFDLLHDRSISDKE